MTLKQIAKNNDLDYGLVYSGAREAGLLIRHTKNAEYDEKDVLIGVELCLSKRIEKHLVKTAELTEMRERILRNMGKE